MATEADTTAVARATGTSHVRADMAVARCPSVPGNHHVGRTPPVYDLTTDPSPIVTSQAAWHVSLPLSVTPASRNS